MTTTGEGTDPEHFLRRRVDLVLLFSSWADALTAIKELLRALVRIYLHASFITTDSANHAWWTGAPPFVKAATKILAYVSRWQLSIAVRILRLVLIEHSLVLHHALLFVSDLAMFLGEGWHLVRI